ncbi:MAG: hypothetical protein Q8Q09_00070 [Deltaproteobacteria bacterium]|nr:hypothetical protein [Deltaproteobacteria bacterium]
MTYVTSGQFQSDLTHALGHALTKEPDEVDPLGAFAEPLRTELRALRELRDRFEDPKLCVLNLGDFCSVPALTDEARDEVLSDWFDGDEEATDFVMTAVDIVNGGGGFYIVVAPDGRMGCVTEDPYGLRMLTCTLEPFLKALVAAHLAVRTEGLKAATQALRTVVDAKTAKLLLTFAERLAPKRRT